MSEAKARAPAVNTIHPAGASGGDGTSTHTLAFQKLQRPQHWHLTAGNPARKTRRNVPPLIGVQIVYLLISSVVSTAFLGTPSGHIHSTVQAAEVMVSKHSSAAEQGPTHSVSILRHLPTHLKYQDPHVVVTVQ